MPVKNQLMKAVGLQDSLLLDKQKKIEKLMEKNNGRWS